ncbi:MAG: single-stranded DNA-binding protein [Candidatus Riflebacteria bacterium]|nr:single-stranded DNA-binding protein [Candidatus Riflebacteria bacterium]
MVSVNRVILAGNLASDPQFKETSNGKALTVFPVAVNKHWRNKAGEQKKETTFFRIIVWNNIAENCARYLKKGGAVLVEGRLQTRSFTNSVGKTQYMTEVVGDQVTFLNKPSKEHVQQEEEPAIM